SNFTRRFLPLKPRFLTDFTPRILDSMAFTFFTSRNFTPVMVSVIRTPLDDSLDQVFVRPLTSCAALDLPARFSALGAAPPIEVPGTWAVAELVARICPLELFTARILVLPRKTWTGFARPLPIPGIAPLSVTLALPKITTSAPDSLPMFRA
ncbi:MAG: hypothetical protein CMH55_04485, partial [Myxococcales bacterium]|nr:hypothetical protein [Myxococcales bacterium]